MTAKLAKRAIKPALPPLPRKRSVDSDPLTGELLLRDTPKIRLPSDRVDSRPTRVAHEDGFRADTTPPPLRLHSGEVETATPADGPAATDRRGSLGGPPFSLGMQRFIQSGLDNQRSERRDNDTIWHRSAYGRGRVHTAFAARYGPQAGKLAYLAALAYASGDQDAASIAHQAGKTVRWVVSMADLARKVAGKTVERTHA